MPLSCGDSGRTELLLGAAYLSNLLYNESTAKMRLLARLYGYFCNIHAIRIVKCNIHLQGCNNILVYILYGLK